MEYIEKIKKTLCKELDEYAMKNKFTSSDIEMLYKVTDIVKNLDKIAMLEEDSGYSEARGGRSRGGRSYDGGSSYDDDDMMYSQRRGRGRNAKRDDMGRYARDGYSSDDYSGDGRSSYERGGSSYRSNYSRGDAKDHMMHKLGEMMEDADPKEREALRKCMRAIEEA